MAREVSREIADCQPRRVDSLRIADSGQRRKAEGGRRIQNAAPRSPLPLAPGVNSPRRAFTLTELLVVIAIIAILTALIVPAVIKARIVSQEGAIMTEVNQLTHALEEMKNKFGSYPPNGMFDSTNPTNAKNNLVLKITSTDFVRWYKKAFQRSQDAIGVMYLLAGDNSALAGTAKLYDENDNLVANGVTKGLRADEAIYFWLGGFSSDPQYPISGPGGPSFLVSETEVIESRNRLYEFDLTRLGPRDDATKSFKGRYVQYDDPRTGDLRQINLWTYQGDNSESNLSYFATNHKPADYDVNLGVSKDYPVFAPIKLREGITAANNVDDYVFVNPDKFQILHPGLDNTWGEDFQFFDIRNFDSGTLLTYPDGPFIGDIADTLSNISNGRFDKAQQ